jgi:tyrosyl-tRNA synthetase
LWHDCGGFIVCAQEVEGNPCLSYIQHIVLPWCDAFDVERPEANGGSK